MAISDLYDITTTLTSPGGTFQFTSSYRMTVGSIAIDTMERTCFDFQFKVEVALQGILCDNVAIDNYRMTPMAGSNEIPGVVENVNTLGGIASQPLPNNMALVMHKSTDAPNAKHNGRSFIAGTPETQQDDGAWQAGYLIAGVALGFGLNASLAAGAPNFEEFEPVVISRYENKILRPSPVGFLVQGVIPQPFVHQQRRRTTRQLGHPA